MPTYRYRGPTSDALANQYASRYRGPTNPYAQPRKSTTVKYLGSAKATNDALPQSRLNTLNRVYNSYIRPAEQQYAKQYGGKTYRKNDVSGQVTPVPGIQPGGARATDPRQGYTPVLFSSPFAAGGYFGSTTGMYQPELTNYVQGRGYGKSPYARGTDRTTAAYFGNPNPMIPYYNFIGPRDPTGFLADYKRSQGFNPVNGPGYSGESNDMYQRRFVQGQYGAKFKAWIPTEDAGYTDLGAGQDTGYGGYGGYGGGYPRYAGGGYGGGSYSRSAPSGGEPQQASGANVQYAGRGQQGYQPGYQLPQWYRKLLSWNF